MIVPVILSGAKDLSTHRERSFAPLRMTLPPCPWSLTLLILISILVSCSDIPSLPPKLPQSLLLGPYSYTPPPSHQQGTITFSSTQFPSAVNPLFSGSSIDLQISTALWSAPIIYDQRFHVHPNQLTEVPLPENGDVRDGGKTIIMHLRHDLRWSDGHPILASDFQYWWQLDQNPNTGALITSGYDQIASINTPDNFTVILHI